MPVSMGLEVEGDSEETSDSLEAKSVGCEEMIKDGS